MPLVVVPLPVARVSGEALGRVVGAGPGQDSEVQGREEPPLAAPMPSRKAVGALGRAQAADGETLTRTE